MFAVVDLGGSQVKVEEGDTIRVNTIEGEPGDKVTLEKVILIGQDGDTKIGTPRVEGASVEASIIEHGKAKKNTKSDLSSFSISMELFFHLRS